jgi:hypothetical protein
LEALAEVAVSLPPIVESNYSCALVGSQNCLCKRAAKDRLEKWPRKGKRRKKKTFPLLRVLSVFCGPLVFYVSCRPLTQAVVTSAKLFSGRHLFFMKVFSILLSFVLLLSVNSFAQKISKSKTVGEKPAAADDGPLDLAKATVAAHGGDKLKNMKSLVVRGSVDVTGAFSMVIPATFALAIAGDKYMFELNNPVQPLKQVSDGRQTYSTGYELPPVTSLGFPLLPKVGETGYSVSALPEGKKNKKGFRITSADGFYTDFFIDEKTHQLKSYESAYDVGGRIVTTSVEIDEFQTVEGVIIPKRYSQRIDLGQITAYFNFKTKEMLVNSQLDDALFAIPK